MSPLTRRQHNQLANDIMRTARPLLPAADANSVAYRYQVESELARDEVSIEIRLAAHGATYMDFWMFHVPVSLVEGATSFASLRSGVVQMAALTLVANAAMAWINGEDYPAAWPSHGPREAGRIRPASAATEPDEARRQTNSRRRHAVCEPALQAVFPTAWDRLLRDDIVSEALQ